MKTSTTRDAHERAAESASSTLQGSASTQLFADNRPEAAIQRQQQRLISESPQTAQLQAAQRGIVQREGDDDDDVDWDNIQGRKRSNAIVPGSVDATKMKLEAMLAAHGDRNPLDAAAVAATPKDGLLSKAKRFVLGDKRSTAEKAQSMAAESTRKNIDERARANQLGLLGRRAEHIPIIGGEKVRYAAAGHEAIAQENAEAHRKIKQSLALKGTSMVVSAASAATSLIPVDPVSQGLIGGAIKAGGAGLSYAGSAREGESGAMLSEQAAARTHDLMTMNLAAEGRARTENADVGRKKAKADAVKAFIPGSGMLGAVGVDQVIAAAAPKVASKVVDKAIGPTEEQEAAVRATQADAQIAKERLGAVSIRGPSKKHMSPEEYARAKKQQELMRATQASVLPTWLGGRERAVDRLRPVDRSIPEPAAAAEESELEKRLRLQRERLERQGQA